MKVIAITGGGQGIGRAIATHFARAGFMTGQNITIDGGMTVKMI